MATYERINELKKIKFTIFESNKVTKDDLFLKDENGETYLDYIIKKNISIVDDSLIQEISNDYDVLFYMIGRKYYLSEYKNIDLLFDESRGKSLIELMLEKDFSKILYMSPEIINRLFLKNNGKYPIEKLINTNMYFATSYIKEMLNYNILYDCLADIGRLDLMLFSNENCLLAKNSSGITILEELIDKGYNFKPNNNSYRIAQILYDKGQYAALLSFDSKILNNYPSKEDNYLKRLIQKYKEGVDIPFDEGMLKSNENKYVAKAVMLLLESGIPYGIKYNLFNSFTGERPIILYLLEMNKDLTLKNYDIKEIYDGLKEYVADVNDIDVSSMEKFDFKDLPNKDKLKEDLLAGKVKEIKKGDIYREDLLSEITDGVTILEYALKNNIKVYALFPKTIEEAMVFVKCNKKVSINETLLFEPIDDDRKFVDYLMENKYFDYIDSSVQDLRIIDYYLKYDACNFISFKMLQNLLVMDNSGNFLIEKYLNNDSFYTCFKDFQLSDDKVKRLCEKGYSKMLLYGSLELLINYPDKEHNNLQNLIDDNKKGEHIRFEDRSYICDDKEVMARCYIQMIKNGLRGYLNDLEVDDLLDKGSSENNLLYYLIKTDKEVTLDYLTVKMRMNPKVFEELKMLGVPGALLDMPYEEFDCDGICRTMYNEEYAASVVSPVEDLLEELRNLFYNDNVSDKELVDALVISYRYSTSVNPIFIEELKQLIQIKKDYPGFRYTKEANKGYFNVIKGVVVNDTIISTLNHETGHAMHYYLTLDAVPSKYGSILEQINQDSTFIARVEEYSKRFYDEKKEVKKISQDIVSKYIAVTPTSSEYVNDLLLKEKEKMISKYKEKGYSEETLNVVLDGAFTIDEFLMQKSEIEMSEVADVIIRYDYDGMAAIGDIIDAILGGKFRSNLLKNAKGEVIKGTYGHGIRYYLDDKTKFSEMIANYMDIIKSKNSMESLAYLRYIVGDKLVDFLDEFYMNNIVHGQKNQLGRR